jgi:hypothetical protein
VIAMCDKAEALSQHRKQVCLWPPSCVCLLTVHAVGLDPLLAVINTLKERGADVILKLRRVRVKEAWCRQSRLPAILRSLNDASGQARRRLFCDLHDTVQNAVGPWVQN